jgi:hypothetical protein
MTSSPYKKLMGEEFLMERPLKATIPFLTAETVTAEADLAM